MKLAANLTLLYGHLPLAERFGAAVADGFMGAEVLLPYDESPDWYAAAVRDSGLVLALINTPVEEGVARGGLAAVPGWEQRFLSGFARAIEVALATGCPSIHVMAGYVEGHAPEACHATLIGNLQHAVPLAARHGITLSLEALNRTDMPGYFYHRPEQALAIVRHFDSPHLRLQFNYFHCMREGLNLREEVARAKGWVGHAQIAGVHGRHEPDLSQHELQAAVEQLEQGGYTGWLGCEYRPRTTPAEGLAWCEPLRDAGVLP